MLATVEHVVGRMNGLMLQLRTGSSKPVDSPRHVDLCGDRPACLRGEGGVAHIDRHRTRRRHWYDRA